jgi:nicotinate phosphoribosyltransferase
MSILNGRRLPAATFKLDAGRMREGWYSDKYFTNIVRLLAGLSSEKYSFAGQHPRLDASDAEGANVGDLQVEMQWFTRRTPFSIVVGVDKALAILKLCTGYFDSAGNWVGTFDRLEVEAVHDGFVATYEGQQETAVPVLKVRGRYRDFALLETPTLGALTRGTRVATNVYEVLRAARGKQVLFFPARFDAHEVQAADGYAYHTAVQAFNHAFGKKIVSTVSTDEQGDWWGGAGGGTVAHAAIACFFGDTAEAMTSFARILPSLIPRIALVDFNNNCVVDACRTASALFREYRSHTEAGNLEEARKYILYGVRLDTSGNLIDQSLQPSEASADYGVNPQLVHRVREALDSAFVDWKLPLEWRKRASDYCKSIKISVTGGFTPTKIRVFEDKQVPVDVYGVGSYLFSNSSEIGTNNDFTADVVRVKVGNQWYDLAKTGRQPLINPALLPVDLNAL